MPKKKGKSKTKSKEKPKKLILDPKELKKRMPSSYTSADPETAMSYKVRDEMDPDYDSMGRPYSDQEKILANFDAKRAEAEKKGKKFDAREHMDTELKTHIQNSGLYHKDGTLKRPSGFNPRPNNAPEGTSFRFAPRKDTNTGDIIGYDVYNDEEEYIFMATNLNEAVNTCGEVYGAVYAILTDEHNTKVEKDFHRFPDKLTPSEDAFKW